MPNYRALLNVTKQELAAARRKKHPNRTRIETLRKKVQRLEALARQQEQPQTDEERRFDQLNKKFAFLNGDDLDEYERLCAVRIREFTASWREQKRRHHLVDEHNGQPQPGIREVSALLVNRIDAVDFE